MTEDDVTLYSNLMRLCDKDESSFYYVDQLIDNIKYRIHLYRLASWTEFQQPDALWSRGTIFELNKHSKPVRLACRPFAKFFNLGEGMQASSHDFSDDNIEVIMDKLDGSLISSYIHYPDAAYYPNERPQVRLKTKGSLHSEQAVAAYKWLQQPENGVLRTCINADTHAGYTVCCELISPLNRIVLGYEHTELKVLSLIDNASGETLPYADTVRRYPEGTMVANYTEEAKQMGVANYIQSVHAMTGVEGIVIRLKDGLQLKVKGTDYLNKHRARDSIHHTRGLYEAVVNEVTDDMRELFKDDPVVMSRMLRMEEHVRTVLDTVTSTVRNFYDANAHLDRKSYAIKSKAETPDPLFGLTMMVYIEKEIDFTEFMLKHYDIYKPVEVEPTVIQDE